jgi:hypothetical protein
MIVHVREHQVVNAGTHELLQVCTVMWPDAAVAQEWDKRMSLDQLRERRRDWAVAIITRFGEDTYHVRAVLRHRGVQVCHRMHQVDPHRSKRRAEAHARQVISYEHDN